MTITKLYSPDCDVEMLNAVLRTEFRSSHGFCRDDVYFSREEVIETMVDTGWGRVDVKCGIFDLCPDCYKQYLKFKHDYEQGVLTKYFLGGHEDDQEIRDERS